MNEPLHPSTLGEILDRTAHLYRSRFLVFLGIASIPTGVVLAFAMGIFSFIFWFGSFGIQGNQIVDPAAAAIAVMFFAVTVLVALPIYMAVTALGTAAMNHAVARPWQDEKTTIRDAYRTVWRRGWSYTGSIFLRRSSYG